MVNQKLYYRILTIKLVNQKKNYNGDYRCVINRIAQQQQVVFTPGGCGEVAAVPKALLFSVRKTGNPVFRV